VLPVLPRRARPVYARQGNNFRRGCSAVQKIHLRRNRQTFADDVKDLPSPASVDGEDLADELRHHLLDAIAQLRPRAVEILILHYEHNYSDAEIAKMLGKSRGTIAVTLYRARARLKRLMSRASERSVPSAESVAGVERRTAKS
jgi:RNA polymerase sigma factor (sigma-70 family)